MLLCAFKNALTQKFYINVGDARGDMTGERVAHTKLFFQVRARHAAKLSTEPSETLPRCKAAASAMQML
jgi:hypothetical protein